MNKYLDNFSKIKLKKVVNNIHNREKSIKILSNEDYVKDINEDDILLERFNQTSQKAIDLYNKLKKYKNKKIKRKFQSLNLNDFKEKQIKIIYKKNKISNYFNLKNNTNSFFINIYKNFLSSNKSQKNNNNQKNDEIKNNNLSKNFSEEKNSFKNEENKINLIYKNNKITNEVKKSNSDNNFQYFSYLNINSRNYKSNNLYKNNILISLNKKSKKNLIQNIITENNNFKNSKKSINYNSTLFSSTTINNNSNTQMNNFFITENNNISNKTIKYKNKNSFDLLNNEYDIKKITNELQLIKLKESLNEFENSKAFQINVNKIENFDINDFKRKNIFKTKNGLIKKKDNNKILSSIHNYINTETINRPKYFKKKFKSFDKIFYETQNKNKEINNNILNKNKSNLYNLYKVNKNNFSKDINWLKSLKKNMNEDLKFYVKNSGDFFYLFNKGDGFEKHLNKVFKGDFYYKSAKILSEKK